MIWSRASLLGLVVAIPLTALVVNACVADEPSVPSGASGDGDAASSGDGTTGGNDGATGGDGQTPPPGSCDLSKDFAAPIAVAGLGAIGSAARFSQDELTAYFAVVARDGGPTRIARAQRSSISAAFGPPVELPELAISGGHGENHPTVTTSGLTIYYAVGTWTDGGLGKGDIVVAQRGAVDASFGAPLLVPGMNTPADEEEPYVAASGELWFATDRDNDGGVDHLYRARNVGSGLGAPGAVTEVDALSDTDQYPVITNDGLTLYFSRRGASTQLLDVWTATRAQASDTFLPPKPLASVNTVDNERASWVSPDGCRLYITRGTIPLQYSVYVASKPAN